MENLNAETVKKALECCTYGGDVTKSQVEVCSPCPYFNEGNCTDVLKENALSLIKELTEERDGFENLIHTMSEIENRMSDTIEELTEQNERLRAENETLEISNKDFKYRIYELSRDNEEWEHENNDLECDNNMLRERITEIKADTVRKMQSEIKDRCIKGGIYPAFVANVIDQIAKEMLEEEK